MPDIFRCVIYFQILSQSLIKSSTVSNILCHFFGKCNIVLYLSQIVQDGLWQFHKVSKMSYIIDNSWFSSSSSFINISDAINNKSLFHIFTLSIVKLYQKISNVIRICQILKDIPRVNHIFSNILKGCPQLRNIVI